MKPEFKDVEHLLRLAGIFAAGVILFIVARAVFVPDDFGVLGHYRASAEEANRAKPLAYAGQAACIECHSDVAEKRVPSGHAKVSCETCHGPQAAHAASGENKPPRPDGRELCARCHAANTGKPKWYRTVNIKDHAGDEKCITCHTTPHDPRIQ